MPFWLKCCPPRVEIGLVCCGVCDHRPPSRGLSVLNPHLNSSWTTCGAQLFWLLKVCFHLEGFPRFHQLDPLSTKLFGLHHRNGRCEPGGPHSCWGVGGSGSQWHSSCFSCTWCARQLTDCQSSLIRAWSAGVARSIRKRGCFGFWQSQGLSTLAPLNLFVGLTPMLSTKSSPISSVVMPFCFWGSWVSSPRFEIWDGLVGGDHCRRGNSGIAKREWGGRVGGGDDCRDGGEVLATRWTRNRYVRGNAF